MQRRLLETVIRQAAKAPETLWGLMGKTQDHRMRRDGITQKLQATLHFFVKSGYSGRSGNWNARRLIADLTNLALDHNFIRYFESRIA